MQRPGWFALCALLIGYALQIGNGFYTVESLAVLIGAVVAAAVAFVAPSWRELLPRPSAGNVRQDEVPAVASPPINRGLTRLLLVGILTNLLILSLMRPGLYLRDPWPHQHPFLLGGLACAACSTALLVFDPVRARRVWFPFLLAIALALGVWMIRASPEPSIDVVTVHKYAIAALRDGYDPYAITFPNIYGGSQFYAEELTKGGKVLFGLPYPPLSLFMAMPGQLWFNDIRVAELAALIVGAAFLGYAPHAEAGHASVAPLAAALLLFTPRSLFVLEQGWTEAFAICWLGATVYTAYRQPRLFPWALALLVGVKQHLVLAVPLSLLMLPRPFDPRDAVRLLWPSLVVSLALALPFLIWNPASFLHSVVWLQFIEPLRSDSLSVLSALVGAGWAITRDSPIVLILPLSALIAGYLIAWRYAPRTPAGFAASLGFTLLLLFLFSKKAFCNYYFLVIASFCAAIAADGALYKPPWDRASRNH